MVSTLSSFFCALGSPTNSNNDLKSGCGRLSQRGFRDTFVLHVSESPSTITSTDKAEMLTVSYQRTTLAVCVFRVLI